MDQNVVTTNAIEASFPSDEDDDNDLRLYGSTQDTTASVPKVRPGLKEVT